MGYWGTLTLGALLFVTGPFYFLGRERASKMAARLERAIPWVSNERAARNNTPFVHGCQAIVLTLVGAIFVVVSFSNILR
jgi:hypothetical protein